MVNAIRRGSGSPLVLVHGLGSRLEAYDAVLDRLAERHEVLALDLPGFGRSPADPAVEASPAGFARWLADHLAGLGIERPHVVGNSMGGGIALELGRAGVAGRVTAFSPIGFWKPAGIAWTRHFLTTLRTVGTTFRRPLSRGVSSFPVRAALVGPLIAKPGNVTPEAARLALDGLLDAAAFEAARDSFRTYAFGEPYGALPDIPVTIAWGTRDYLLTHRTQSARARAQLPFAQHIDLPGCGHVPFSDDPELCASVILSDPWKALR